jgi:hypothetical protein
MPGILDEVMDGITAKEKQTPPEGGQAAPPAQGGKGLYEYSDKFKERYGEQKKT